MFSMWYGLSFWNGGGGGMLRLGDSLTWNQPDPARSYRFSVLAADKDVIHETNRTVLSTHPDDLGLMNQVISRGDGKVAPLPGWGFVNMRWYFSRWQGEGDARIRGRVDRNFLMTDSSVQRLEQLRVLGEEDRVVAIPEFMAGSSSTDPGQWRNFLPPDSVADR